MVQPPHALLDSVTIRKSGPGVFDPLKNAEKQLWLIEDEFQGWLEEELASVSTSWRALKTAPSDSLAFRAFHKSLHSILGHGEIFGCEAVTILARPIAKLLERQPCVEKHLELLELGTTSIKLAVREKLAANDPRIIAAALAMDDIVDRWLARKLAD